MNDDVLIYAASIMLFLWGIGRFINSKSGVAGYGEKSGEGSLILNFDLAAEGIGISLIGFMSILITILVGPARLGSIIIYALAGVTLFILSLWSFSSVTKEMSFTSRICPLVKLTLASFYFWAVYLSLG